MRPAPAAWLAACIAWGAVAHAEEAKPKDKDYTLSLVADANALHMGLASQAVVTLHPQPPWNLKVTTPFEAIITGTGGIALTKAKFSATDFIDPKVADKSFSVPFVPQAAGPQSLRCNLNFFLCTDEVCQRYKETLELKLDVK